MEPERGLVCGAAQMSHSPHGVGAVTGAVFVTDEAVETRRTEPLLAIRAFKASFTETGSVDMMTLGSILTLTLLVTLQTEAAHRTVILAPGGDKKCEILWEETSRTSVEILHYCGNMEWKTMKLTTLCHFYCVQGKPTSSSSVTEFRTAVEFLSHEPLKVTIDFFFFFHHWNIQI